MTVAELEGRMPAHELVEWQAWYAIDADQALRNDMRRGALGRLEQLTRKKKRS